MAAASAQIAVPSGASATKLTALDSGDRLSGDTLVLTNVGTVDVLVGGPGVTTANGWRGLKVGTTLTIDVAEDLYAVVAGATAGAVDVLRVK